MSVTNQFQSVAAEVQAVSEKAGRPASDVLLVAVSKTVGLDEVQEAIRVGASDFGENRPDQLMQKADAFPDANWHFIGNVQSRRIRDIVGRATLIHSLFEERHARKISEIAQEKGMVQDVLLEVNVSGEASKSGLAPAEVPAMLETCRSLPGLRVRGLMTMAPQGDLPAAREAFQGLRALRDELRASLPEEEAAVFEHLSMGMSEDWPIAIEEGATIVRIGRAVFSPSFE